MSFISLIYSSLTGRIRFPVSQTNAEVGDWDVVFEGNDGQELEQFILGVRKQAFAKGMQKNDTWIAQFVAAHIGGGALRWYETLDEDTQNSWKLLRRALLSQYPPATASR